VSYILSPLPYSFDALEPYIDRKTMELHYTKHHQGYVNNLNAALVGYPQLAKLPINSLLQQLNTAVPQEIRTIVQNQGGGHANHEFFWQVMKQKGGGEPAGEIAAEIKREFGFFGAFKDSFDLAARSVFGSGWAWLVLEKGRLKIVTTANQDSPRSKELIPILGLDVWEHAYYLSYQNRRADYITAWWHVINWDVVEENYRVAK
jgi:Fe-Mn family superoxide dismutase